MSSDSRDYEEERYWREFCDFCGTMHDSDAEADAAHDDA